MKRKLSLTNLVLIIAAALVFTACTNAHIQAGDEYYENLSYSRAISKYEKALKGQPENLDVKLKLANAHRILNNSVAAENYYQEVADSIDLPMEEKLNFAQVLMKNNKYDKAQEYLTEYLKANPNDQLARDLLASINNVEELKEDTSAYLMEALPLDFLVSMFGPSRYQNGIVFAGETEIVSAASANPWTGYSFLDLFYVEKDASGNWDIPQPFSETLNGRFHDGPATFNSAGDMIIYTRSAMRNERKRLVNEKNENQFYLYQSKKENGEWSEPEKLPFNSTEYSIGHPALTNDGKTLYFSSDMPGGYGGSDLYKSTYENGSWSEPLNLGSTINTPGNEVFPHVTKDGKLYFSSEGHRTLGGLDVFYSKNVGGVWSAPINLAYPLNSSRDDFSISVNDNDTTGFVSSNRSGVDMIYEYTRIPPIFILEGIAKRKADQLPMADVTITLINLSDGDTAIFKTSRDGKFKFNLLPQKNYKVIGEKEGYFTLSEEFKTDKKGAAKEIDFVFEIDEIVTSKEGTGSGEPLDGSETAEKTYDIGEIYYDYNKADIRESAQPSLDKLARLLKDNPGIKVEIHSHSDARGSDAYNLNLSNRRAQSVVDYLVRKGISKSRLQSKGFGESQPVNKCVDGVECTEEQYQKNRRSEFIVLDKAQS